MLKKKVQDLETYTELNNPTEAPINEVSIVNLVPSSPRLTKIKGTMKVAIPPMEDFSLKVARQNDISLKSPLLGKDKNPLQSIKSPLLGPKKPTTKIDIPKTIVEVKETVKKEPVNNQKRTNLNQKLIEAEKSPGVITKSEDFKRSNNREKSLVRKPTLKDEVYFFFNSFYEQLISYYSFRFSKETVYLF